MKKNNDFEMSPVRTLAMNCIKFTIVGMALSCACFGSYGASRLEYPASKLLAVQVLQGMIELCQANAGLYAYAATLRFQGLSIDQVIQKMLKEYPWIDASLVRTHIEPIWRLPEPQSSTEREARINYSANVGCNISVNGGNKVFPGDFQPASFGQ